MATKPDKPDRPGTDAKLYGLYDELDRLEELIEDMGALDVTSIAEAEQRIAALNDQIDAAEDEGQNHR